MSLEDAEDLVLKVLTEVRRLALRLACDPPLVGWWPCNSLSVCSPCVCPCLTQTMQDKVTSANVEICSITPDAGYTMYPGARLEALIKRAAAAAAAEEDA